MLSILLAEKCREEGLSAHEAAKAVGVSHTTILRAQRGVVVDLPTLIKIAAWLGVKPATLHNSMSLEPDALPDKIAAALEVQPELAKVFRNAVEAVVERGVSPALIREIALFSAFAIGLKAK